MMTVANQTELLEHEADLYTTYLEDVRAGRPVELEKVLLDLPEDRRDDMRKVLRMAEFMTDLFPGGIALPAVPMEAAGVVHQDGQ